MDKDTCIIFVLGGPGAGKGTQCANLVRDYNFVHLSAGDLLRAEQSRPNSQYAELIETYIKEGKIVPKEITIALLKQAMVEHDFKRFLIDGFPRALDQAIQFEETAMPPRAVLFFSCPEEVMLKRLLKRGETSGRVDDNIDSIKKRFKTFKETSMPVIDMFREQKKLYEIDCNTDPDKVYVEVRKAMEKILS